MVSISLDITFFIQMVLFGVCVFVLNILVYKPVMKVMEERAKKLSDLDTDAGKIETDVESKLAGYKKKIEEAKEKGNFERATLKKEGLEKENEIVSAAHFEAQETISKAKKKIEKEKENALKCLKDMTGTMGREIAEKALGRSL